jgi:hypothetical protein
VSWASVGTAASQQIRAKDDCVKAQWNLGFKRFSPISLSPAWFLSLRVVYIYHKLKL